MKARRLLQKATACISRFGQAVQFLLDIGLIMSSPTQNEILVAIRKAASDLEKIPSRREFTARSGISEHHVLSHFPSWVEAVRAAGVDIRPTNVKLRPELFLKSGAVSFVSFGESRHKRFIGEKAATT